MSNPEFQMQGISFVVAAPGGSAHPLPFKFRLPNGKRVEIQHNLQQSFTIIEVIAELRLLANNLQMTITESPQPLDFPEAVAGPTLHSAPVDLKPPQP